MSEHAEKGHPIGAVIMVAIISGLMNNGDVASASAAGVLLFGTGLYAVFGLARA